MTSMFRPASRKKSKLRMAIDGVSGSGKTFTALRFAFELGQRVAVINSESGAIEKYLGLAPDGTPWQFDVCELNNFAPTAYTQAILNAGSSGYDVLLIDSLSHAWAGSGGALELKDKKTGNSFTAWKDITPMHNQMIEAILRSPCHVIVTMRSKTGYVLELDQNGKQVPKKVGLEPVQRQGMEYEFDIYASMDSDHVMRVSKSRCPSLDSAIVVKPGAETMASVVQWLNDGVQVDPSHYAVKESDLRRLEEVTAKAAKEEVAKQPKRSAMEVIQEKAARSTAATAKPKSEPETHDPPADGYSTADQRKAIFALLDEVFDDSSRVAALNKALEKRGVNTLHSLTEEQAGELIAKLEERKAAMQPAAQEVNAESAGGGDTEDVSLNQSVVEGATTTYDVSPCTPAQIDEIKQLLAEWEQEKPGVTRQYKERLLASGRQKIAELTVAEADACKSALANKVMEAFFANSLKKKGGGAGDDIPF